ncbi:hypothetical protein FRC11_005052, partial [Ceratobasidium sp. 423]
AILSHLGVIKPDDHFSKVKGSELPKDKWEDPSEFDYVANPNHAFDNDSDLDIEDLLTELEEWEMVGLEAGPDNGGMSTGTTGQVSGCQTKHLTVTQKDGIQ